MNFDFNTLEELKDTTSLDLISTSTPVLGFLPILEFLCLTAKVPNEDILTSSPLSSSDKINSNIFSITSEDSDNDKPTLSLMASIKSFLVHVFSYFYTKLIFIRLKCFLNKLRFSISYY